MKGYRQNQPARGGQKRKFASRCQALPAPSPVPVDLTPLRARALPCPMMPVCVLTQRDKDMLHSRAFVLLVAQC